MIAVEAAGHKVALAVGSTFGSGDDVVTGNRLLGQLIVAVDTKNHANVPLVVDELGLEHRLEPVLDDGPDTWPLVVRDPTEPLHAFSPDF